MITIAPHGWLTALLPRTSPQRKAPPARSWVHVLCNPVERVDKAYMLSLVSLQALLQACAASEGHTMMAGVEIHVERGSTKVPLRPPLPPPPVQQQQQQQQQQQPTSSSSSSSAQQTVDLAGQAGECESGQVWLRSTGTDLWNVTAAMSTLSSSGGAGEIAAAAWGIFQMGYVNCSSSKTPVYHPAGGGWHPDPLLVIPPHGIALVPAGLAQPIFLTLCIPRATPPGNYTGRLQLSSSGGLLATTLQVAVEVWPLVIPTLRDGVFEGTWTFGSPNFTRFYPDPSPHHHTVSSWYPANRTFDPIHNRTTGVCCSLVQEKWFEFFAAHRTAADPCENSSSIRFDWDHPTYTCCAHLHGLI